MGEATIPAVTVAGLERHANCDVAVDPQSGQLEQFDFDVLRGDGLCGIQADLQGSGRGTLFFGTAADPGFLIDLASPPAAVPNVTNNADAGTSCQMRQLLIERS